MDSVNSGGVWANLRQTAAHRLWRGLGLSLGLALCASAWANGDVEKNIANEKNWAMQAGDMANTRYSRLGQINKGIDMDNACPQPAFAQWAFYDSQHPRNVVRLYLQTEREALFSTEMANP